MSEESTQTEEKKIVPTILVMWSGGITSTAILFDLLSNEAYKDFDIIAHHMYVQDITNRYLQEANACKDILTWLTKSEKHKHFFFSESNHNFNFLRPPRYGKLVRDLDLAYFTAAQIVTATPAIVDLAIGLNKADLVADGFDIVKERSEGIMSSATKGARIHPKFKVTYPYSDTMPPKIYKSLPNEVREMVFSCVNPKYKDNIGTACGKCFKCKSREEYGID